MKIIQNGNLELMDEPKRFVCAGCNCLFEAIKGEYKSGSQYNETYYYCRCPCCGKISVLWQSSI